ncbi:MAG TPA: peptidylprolyl isomerase [Candidatus Cloacimonadota bacterium]|nr:peptidylprolyl isomerase [Candidatus Cloacimonadota bacterium]
MLEDLRKKQKIVIWIVAVVFIIGMGAMGFSEIFRPKDYLGKVNGKVITMDMFRQQIAKVEEQYAEQLKGQPMDENTRKSIQDMAWNQLVNEILLAQQIKKHRIKVSEAEITSEMLNNPPQELMQNPSFQVNGRFDKNKYVEILKTNTQFFAMMDEYVRKALPQKKLQKKIAEKGGINQDSLKAEYAKETNLVNGKAIWFDYNKIDSVSVSDAEIKARYEKDKETLYKKGPASRIKYLSFELKASDKDFADVKKQIDLIYNETQTNPDFGALATKYSEDPGSAANKGSLGEFGKGQMVPEFEQAAFAQKPGQISKPVKTSFGWHIIKTDSLGGTATEPKVKASHILLKVDPSEATIAALRKKAEETRKQISKKGIDEVAKALKMEAMDSKMVAHDAQQIPGLGNISGLMDFMKKAKAKAVSEVYEGQAKQLIVAQQMENKKEYYENFDDLKMRIKFELEKEKKVALTKPIAEAFLAKTNKADYFTAAAAAGWKVIDVKNHKDGSSLEGIAKSDEFTKAALALKTGEISGLINTKEGQFVVMATERRMPDFAAFAKDKAKTEEIQKRLEEAAFNRWFDALRKDAKIIDNRAKFGL